MFMVACCCDRSCQQPKTYVKPEAAITVFELLMMGGVSPETCWAIEKHWNNKFYCTVASCWFFLWILYYDVRIHEHQVCILSIHCIYMCCVILTVCDPCLLIGQPLTGFSKGSTWCSLWGPNQISSMILIYWLLNAFTKLQKETISSVMSVCMSVCPSTWNNSAST